jgi:predicted nucleotidyltransferase
MIKVKFLTETENKVLNKKLENQRLNQVESNYLSRAIRPKLIKIHEAQKQNPLFLLQRIKYNQKAKALEEKIKKIIKNTIKQLDSIIIYGSAIQTNYLEYNDIDILLITKIKFWKKEKEKYFLIKKIKEITKKEGLNLDIQIIDKKTFKKEYPSSPDLIYQLKDSKIIYGDIKIPKKANLSRLNLQIKLDWSEINHSNPEGIEIYKAMRNAILVNLLIDKIVDNYALKESLQNDLGRNLLDKLKNNRLSKSERDVALIYLKELSSKVRKKIMDAQWEKIEL